MRTTNPRAFVPCKAEPLHRLENAGDHLIRGALGVCVLDAKNERPTLAPREQPVEKRRARAANVQIPGRGRSESHARHGHGC